MIKKEMKEKKEEMKQEEIVTEEKVAETENNAEAEAEETAEAAEAAEATEAEPVDDEAELGEELAQLKEALAEKEDQYLRIHAEFDNFRRRTLKEKEELRKTANADLLAALLPVLDNFDRALVHAEDSPILDGIVMVQKQMMDILGAAGLEKAGNVGDVFDPKFHDAIMQEEKEGAAADTILEILQPGYKYRNKLLRAAMVKVAK